MKTKILTSLLGLLFKQLKPEHVTLLVKEILDKAEEVIKSSENTIDDALLLPIIDVARQGLNIED